MEFDRELTVFNGVVGVDPRVTPQTVLARNVFRLRDKDPINTRRSNRLIVALDAPTAETIDFEIWALDSRDVGADGVFTAAAAQRWYLVWTSAGLAGGRLAQTRLAQAAEVYVGGGTFYLRITAETVTADRLALIRSTI